MSREAELYKDKIEVSLDGRQIFYLFFGGSVIVGLVFVLGVMVGRRVEARGHVDRARVAATVDPLAALDRLEGGTGLSFQGSLRGGETPANDVEKQIAAMQKADDKAKKTDTVPEAKADAKVEPKADKIEDKKLAKAVDDKPEQKADKKADDKKADKTESVDDKKLDKKAEDKKTEKLDDKKIEKAEDKNTEKVSDKKTDKADDKKADDKKVDKGDDKKTDKDAKTADGSDAQKPKFTLQLSSFQDKREAQTYLDSIKSSGYQAYVTEGAVDGKQYYRVRMGSYRSMDAANEAKAEFEKGAKKTAIVTRL